ncbi:hypothetical protein AVEN_135147-1 [Araneus ventricosus]|uniref:Uncharacterized protein n=1 Tax=Araneus ventricosus TaxID=182803 RepID=A0A4Y2W8D2_ARAVE|nr:hypothetical protein AVEN_135147-1 [Araneus ventricosus]
MLFGRGAEWFGDGLAWACETDTVTKPLMRSFAAMGWCSGISVPIRPLWRDIVYVKSSAGTAYRLHYIPVAYERVAPESEVAHNAQHSSQPFLREACALHPVSPLVFINRENVLK